MSEGTVKQNSAGLFDLVIRRDGQTVEEIRNLDLRVAAGKLEELLYVAGRKEARGGDAQ